MNSTYLHRFSISILVNGDPAEKIIYRNANYFSMPDNTQYTIELTNDNNVRADAHVSIHGEKIGAWRINPYSKVLVVSPAARKQKLIMSKNSGNTSSKEYGLIKVEFKPAKKSIAYTPSTKDNFDPTNVNYLCKKYTDTVTPYDKTHRSCAMDTNSYDRYVENTLMPPIKYPTHQQIMVDSIDNIDIENITIIYTRLVVDNDRSAVNRYNLIRTTLNPNKTTSSKPPPLELRHPSRPHTGASNSNFTLSQKYMYSDYTNHN
jgi:hypothetical protein